MTIAEIRKAYKECLAYSYKKRKKLPRKSLDILLYVTERYLKWMEEME